MVYKNNRTMEREKIKKQEGVISYMKKYMGIWFFNFQNRYVIKNTHQSEKGIKPRFDHANTKKWVKKLSKESQQIHNFYLRDVRIYTELKQSN